MSKQWLFALIVSAAFGAGTLAAATPTYEPLYIFDGQYTATLQQHSHHWHLQPLRGDEVDVIDHAKDCGSRKPIPNGLWFVSQDATGKPQLVAPSVTALPAGFPQHVALAACGEKVDGDALFVPAVALAWINANVGTVLIDD
ncbi:MAG TPA: hypothetical protein VN720_09055 [Rudaea sp.]|nr:hypothetical protein [Rudaea sp.]